MGAGAALEIITPLEGKGEIGSMEGWLKRATLSAEKQPSPYPTVPSRYKRSAADT